MTHTPGAHSPNGHTTSGTSEPFKIEFAKRMATLPPYLFGRINAMLMQKRRAGDDVIDMGMGNPSEPPQDLVIEKLVEAARDPRNHGYSQSIGILNLRREVASKYFRKYGVRLDPEREIIATLGSKEGFSHMCLVLMGPGDTAIVPSPYGPCVRGHFGRRQLHHARRNESREVLLERRFHLRAPHAATQGRDP
jgi:alanine-synthesizing transaminase